MRTYSYARDTWIAQGLRCSYQIYFVVGDMNEIFLLILKISVMPATWGYQNKVGFGLVGISVSLRCNG